MSGLICNDSSFKAVEFFKEHKQEFGRIKKITTFFDNQNFLLTDYTPSHGHIQAIIENDFGNLMEFANLNCGYGGTGPSATADVLTELGIAESSANQIIAEKGLLIEFSKETGRASIQIPKVLFGGKFSEQLHGGCKLNQYIACNIVSRDVYMINPETNDFLGLLNCLQVMGPHSFAHAIDKQYVFKNFSDISEFPTIINHIAPIGVDGVNLIIRGRKFNIHCLINQEYLFGTLNALYLHLTKTPLFSEDHWRDFAILHPDYAAERISNVFSLPKLIKLLFKRQVEAPCRELSIDEERAGKDES